MTVVVSGLVAAVVASAVSLAVVFLIAPAGRGLFSAETVIQESFAEVPLRGNTMKGETEVFYLRPFAAPPKLIFPESLGGCFVMEQKADSFKLGRDVTGASGYGIGPVKWRAEGVPAR